MPEGTEVVLHRDKTGWTASWTGGRNEPGHDQFSDGEAYRKLTGRSLTLDAVFTCWYTGIDAEKHNGYFNQEN